MFQFFRSSRPAPVPDPGEIARQDDSMRLRNHFFKIYDESLVLDFAKSVQETRPYAQGSCFACHRFQSRGELDLAVKIAHPYYLRNNDPVAVRRWRKGIESIANRSEIPLLPPMQVCEVEESLVLVLPFGDENDDQVLEHWRPLKEACRAFEAGLRNQRYQLDDMIQIRCWQGIPFVIDWSDLRPIED